MPILVFLFGMSFTIQFFLWGYNFIVSLFWSVRKCTFVNFLCGLDDPMTRYFFHSAAESVVSPQEEERRRVEIIKTFQTAPFEEIVARSEAKVGEHL